MPLVAAVLVVAAVCFVGLVAMARTALDAARADAAADAGALAGVAHGRLAASRAVEANGATLVAFRPVGGDVVVEVRCGGATASARGRLVPAASATARPSEPSAPAGAGTAGPSSVARSGVP